jgi:SAM-dependent methyltransferase
LKKELIDISREMIERYSRRYKQLGYDVKTLGWGTREQQTYRFAQTINGAAEFERKSVLDIGCGFGDYGRFLIESNIHPGSYTGWDLNPDLIEEAKKRNRKIKNFHFEVKNLASAEDLKTEFDIAVMLGVLNLNLKGKIDNYEYSRQFIGNAFACVKELLVVDFLSTRLAKEYPAEDFVFYHDPEEMLKFALQLSDNVILKHNYLPIPQKEFMLFIYKV